MHDFTLNISALPQLAHAQHINQLVQLFLDLLKHFGVADGLNCHARRDNRYGYSASAAMEELAGLTAQKTRPPANEVQ